MSERSTSLHLFVQVITRKSDRETLHVEQLNQFIGLKCQCLKRAINNDVANLLRLGLVRVCTVVLLWCSGKAY